MENTKRYEDYIESTYEELGKLSQNAAGTTYLARNRQTGVLVVKKRMSLETGEIYQRLRAIQSPNLVSILEVCFLENVSITVESYISGETLEQRLERQGKFTEEEALHFAKQILRCLQMVHRNGIVHRDLTPANILISVDGIVKIIDFGIARTRKDNQAKDTVIMGTVGYASPEQFGFQQTDARTDLYAFGILLNKMLTGLMPHEQLPANKKMRNIITGCTMIDPKERYMSAGEILKELGEKDVGENIWETDRSIWPGFRRNVTWHKVLAIAGYLYILMGFFGVMVGVTDDFSSFCRGFVSMFLFWIVPFCSLTNFGRWDSRLEIFRRIPKGIRVFMRIILALVFMVIGALIMV